MYFIDDADCHLVVCYVVLSDVDVLSYDDVFLLKQQQQSIICTSLVLIVVVALDLYHYNKSYNPVLP